MDNTRKLWLNLLAFLGLGLFAWASAGPIAPASHPVATHRAL